MSRDACDEVDDILHMFAAIKVSLRDLDDREGIDLKEVTFAGFDGNEETIQDAYARYLLNDLEKFGWIREDFNNNRDSHYPLLEEYRRMLQEWSRYGRNNNLTKEEIIQIAAVRQRPRKESSAE